MALQSSGQISLSDIATEFGGSAPHSLSEYYGSDTVPASGEISIGDFYGTSNITYYAATGGTITTSGDYKVHTFNSSGTFTITTAGNTGIEYLIIAGGGGGGAANSGVGGAGGGAGGYRCSVSGESSGGGNQQNHH